MMKKQRFFHTLWHSNEWVKRKFGDADKFDYSQIDELREFKNSHPEVMQERIKKANWEFTYDPSKNKPRLSIKRRVLDFIEKKFNYRLGEYKDYIILKDSHSP